MKKITYLLTIALISVVVLVSCSSSTASDIHSGANNMLKITSELQSQIQAGDVDKVKELGPKLEEAWSKFEDNVKEKYPDLYVKVEDALDPTIAGTEASPLDKDTLSSFNKQLTQALNDLAQKE